VNKPKVYIPNYLPKEIVAYIEKYCIVETNKAVEGELHKEELFRLLEDKEGAILTGMMVDDTLLSHAPKLKVVSNISVGYNNFDILAMKKRGVIGTNTTGALDDSVADLVFGLILAAARRISHLDAYVKAGNWKEGDNENLFGVEVHNKTLGIIGMGRIGEAVAKRGKLGFDMEILYCNRNRRLEAEESYGAKYEELNSLLSSADFILLMTPLTEETKGLISYKEFALMKPSAIFINASRGQTINEEALIDALVKGKIYGAALDVYEKEPINLDNPLLKLSNVVTTPHIGSATAKTRFDMAMMAAKNLVKPLIGEAPVNVVKELRK